MARPRKPPAVGLYCLRVELKGIVPAIWRRIWAEGDTKLLSLHHTIQAAMGWSDSHFHEFRIGEDVYAIPDPEDDPKSRRMDERRITLSEAMQGTTQFEYVYDFGDNWQHLVVVEATAPPPDQPRGCGFIEAGERACPPDDCGGASGYQDFLGDLKDDPEGTEVKEFLEWAGEDFDPKRFDRHTANAALMRMAWNRWG